MSDEKLIEELRSNIDLSLFGRVRGHYFAPTDLVRQVILVKQAVDMVIVAVAMVTGDVDTLRELTNEGKVKLVVPDPDKAPPENRQYLMAFDEIDDETDVRVVLVQPTYIVQICEDVQCE